MLELINANHLGGPNQTHTGWGILTLVEYVGDFGECRMKTVMENTLPFKPKWYPVSRSGYVQCADVPEEFNLDMNGAVTKWNLRFPENGALFFYDTKEERDSYLLCEE